MSKQKQEMTLKEVYKRLRECLNAVKPSNEKLSGAMRLRLNYNLDFLSVYIQLQGDISSDVQAIGFYDDSQDEDEDDEDGTDEEYGGRT